MKTEEKEVNNFKYRSERAINKDEYNCYSYLLSSISILLQKLYIYKKNNHLLFKLISTPNKCGC